MSLGQLNFESVRLALVLTPRRTDPCDNNPSTSRTVTSDVGCHSAVARFQCLTKPLGPIALKSAYFAGSFWVRRLGTSQVRLGKRRRRKFRSQQLARTRCQPAKLQESCWGSRQAGKLSRFGKTSRALPTSIYLNICMRPVNYGFVGLLNLASTARQDFVL